MILRHTNVTKGLPIACGIAFVSLINAASLKPDCLHIRDTCNMQPVQGCATVLHFRSLQMPFASVRAGTRVD